MKNHYKLILIFIINKKLMKIIIFVYNKNVKKSRYNKNNI